MAKHSHAHAQQRPSLASEPSRRRRGWGGGVGVPEGRPRAPPPFALFLLDTAPLHVIGEAPRGDGLLGPVSRTLPCIVAMETSHVEAMGGGSATP